jgi:hypothetical protein
MVKVLAELLKAELTTESTESTESTENSNSLLEKNHPALRTLASSGNRGLLFYRCPVAAETG